MSIDYLLPLLSVGAFLFLCLLLTGMILLVRAAFVKTGPCVLQINEKITKEVYAGGTLLEALLSQGIPIPSPCGGKATCKQCRVQVFKGGGEALGTEKSSFSIKQLKEGWRLSCQCRVKEDLELHLEESFFSVKQWTAKVLSNKNVATFIKELIIEVPEDIPYRSGSYLQFHVPAYTSNTNDWKQTTEKLYRSDWEHFSMFGESIDYSHLEEGEVIRAYSMASYPAEGRRLIFNIRIASPPFERGKMMDLPWGICSSYLFSLKEGDDLSVSGPYGESFMIEDNRELIFLIGGAGSSFGRSHILHLLHSEKTKRKISLWYGARSLKENIYQEEYEQLAAENPNFSYHLSLSSPLAEDLEKGWPKEDPIRTNFLFKSFELGQLQAMEEPEECLYFVCGPPMHNSSILQLLDNYGVPRENIVLDDFGS